MPRLNRGRVLLAAVALSAVGMTTVATQAPAKPSRDGGEIVFRRFLDVERTPGVDSKHVPKPDVKTGDVLMEKEESKGFRRAFHRAECSALQAWPEELERYPAHMHIDILPEFQRKGWGSMLINALFDALRSQGAIGIHLGMARSNTGGRSFYE